MSKNGRFSVEKASHIPFEKIKDKWEHLEIVEEAIDKLKKLDLVCELVEIAGESCDEEEESPCETCKAKRIINGL